MSKRFGVPILAVIMTLGSVNLARAAYCGAANYFNCSCGARMVSTVQDGAELEAGSVASEGAAASVNDDGTMTIMVNRSRVVYVPEEYTAYRTEYDTVYDERQVNTVNYVRENRTRTVNYTVRRPVWEDRERTINYTVMRPVWEDRQRTINYTVMRPVWEDRERTINYTVMRPVWEDRERDDQLHGDATGVGRASEDDQLHGHATGVGRASEDDQLHGHESRLGNPDEGNSLHRSTSGVGNAREDD